MTQWPVACQASLFMEFSRQEYIKIIYQNLLKYQIYQNHIKTFIKVSRHSSGVPFPSLGDLPNPGIKLLYHLTHQVSPRKFLVHRVCRWDDLVMSSTFAFYIEVE